MSRAVRMAKMMAVMVNRDIKWVTTTALQARAPSPPILSVMM